MATVFLPHICSFCCYFIEAIPCDDQANPGAPPRIVVGWTVWAELGPGETVFGWSGYCYKVDPNWEKILHPKDVAKLMAIPSPVQEGCGVCKAAMGSGTIPGGPCSGCEPCNKGCIRTYIYFTIQCDNVSKPAPPIDYTSPLLLEISNNTNWSQEITDKPLAQGGTGLDLGTFTVSLNVSAQTMHVTACGGITATKTVPGNPSKPLEGFYASNLLTPETPRYKLFGSVFHVSCENCAPCGWNCGPPGGGGIPVQKYGIPATPCPDPSNQVNTGGNIFIVKPLEDDQGTVVFRYGGWCFSVDTEQDEIELDQAAQLVVPGQFMEDCETCLGGIPGTLCPNQLIPKDFKWPYIKAGSRPSSVVYMRIDDLCFSFHPRAGTATIPPDTKIISPRNQYPNCDKCILGVTAELCRVGDDEAGFQINASKAPVLWTPETWLPEGGGVLVYRFRGWCYKTDSGAAKVIKPKGNPNAESEVEQKSAIVHKAMDAYGGSCPACICENPSSVNGVKAEPCENQWDKGKAKQIWVPDQDLPEEIVYFMYGNLCYFLDPEDGEKGRIPASVIVLGMVGEYDSCEKCVEDRQNPPGPGGGGNPSCPGCPPSNPCPGCPEPPNPIVCPGDPNCPPIGPVPPTTPPGPTPPPTSPPTPTTPPGPVTSGGYQIKTCNSDGSPGTLLDISVRAFTSSGQEVHPGMYIHHEEHGCAQVTGFYTPDHDFVNTGPVWNTCISCKEFKQAYWHLKICPDVWGVSTFITVEDLEFAYAYLNMGRDPFDPAIIHPVFIVESSDTPGTYACYVLDERFDAPFIWEFDGCPGAVIRPSDLPIPCFGGQYEIMGGSCLSTEEACAGNGGGGTDCSNCPTLPNTLVATVSYKEHVDQGSGSCGSTCVWIQTQGPVQITLVRNGCNYVGFADVLYLVDGCGDNQGYFGTLTVALTCTDTGWQATMGFFNSSVQLGPKPGPPTGTYPSVNVNYPPPAVCSPQLAAAITVELP